MSEVVGKIKLVNPTVQVSTSFKKRELVVSTEETYTQHILIEFNQDKCDLLNNYQVGQDVKVSINLRGREWINPQGDAKYFNQIQGWRIERTEAQAPQSAVNAYQETHKAQIMPLDNDDDSGLPF